MSVRYRKIFNICGVLTMCMSSTTATSVEAADTESESAIAQYFAKHPRMLGGLFTVLLLLTQVGTVAAGTSATTAGP
jgi:hypothetical protein